MKRLTYGYKETVEQVAWNKMLLVVRDPWQRLLSAYRDKLEATTGPDQFGRHMVTSFRNEGMARFGLDAYRERAGAPVVVEGRSLSNPTFWEFVQWIIRGGEIDRHWNPYYLHCNVCHTNFTDVLKLETLEEEERIFLKSNGLPTLSTDQWRNHGNDTQALFHLYYSSLSLTELFQLQQIYLPDFRLWPACLNWCHCR